MASSMLRRGPKVHLLYFEPEYPDFSPRTMWSLSNAFTSAARIEGGIVFGLCAALYGEITINDGAVVEQNFGL